MTRYSLSEQKRRGELSKAIKAGSLDTLTTDAFRACLPEDEQEMLELINYEDNTGSALEACIRSSRPIVLAELIKLGAKLTVYQLETIFVSTGIDPATKIALFNVVKAHLLARIDQMVSIEDEIFGHISEIESFLFLKYQGELYNYLDDQGFVREFRELVAVKLKSIDVNYSEFINELIKTQSKDTCFSLSEEDVVRKEGRDYYSNQLSPQIVKVESKEEEVYKGRDSNDSISSNTGSISSSSGSRGRDSDELKPEAKDDAVRVEEVIPEVNPSGLRRRNKGLDHTTNPLHDKKDQELADSKETDSLLSDKKSSSHADKVDQNRSGGGILGWLGFK